MRCPGPHHKETDPLESLRQVQDQGHRSQIFFFRSRFEPLHFRQNSPKCSLGFSISTTISIPINPIPLLPLRHLQGPRSFQPTYQRRHKRNPLSTRNILRNQERTSSCKHAAVISHFVPPPRITPPHLLASFVKSRGTFGWMPSHFTPAFCICKASTPSPGRSLSALARPPPLSSTLHCQQLILHVLHVFVTLPVPCPFFPLCLTTVHRPGILFLLSSRICTPSLRAVGLVILCKNQHYRPHS